MKPRKTHPSFLRGWVVHNGFNKDYIMSDKIDLSKCKKGDILISSHGAKLEYIAPTPWKNYNYLDHVVRYIEDKDGNKFNKGNYGTRTNDGYVFRNNRIPETDHDIVKII